MKHRDNNNILQNEFAFRYLYPKEDIETPWPMDEWEQSVVHQVQTGTQDEVCAHFDGLVDNLLCNQINAESPLDQLCLFVYLLSTNLSITPSMAFMRHRTYPSPRSYYPFISQFYYGGSLYEFSEREMSIVRIGEHGAGCGVILKPRFDSYNEIYNLFRKSLLSLELGHLTKQAYELANLLGLQIENRSASALFTFALNVVNEPKLELLHRYMRKARARNSGEYSWGNFPKYASLDYDIEALSFHWYKAIAEVSTRFDDISVEDMALYAWINTQDGESKLYRLAHYQIELVKQGDIAERLQETFSYNNSSFSTLSSCLYIAVPYKFLALKGADAQRIAQCLGYLSQYFINLFSEQGLFSRPFKSFNQRELDSYLNAGQYHEIIGYGLMSAKNRAVAQRAYLV